MTDKTPSRKSPRAFFNNYSGGSYFVTICTRDKTHYFGTIRDEKMYLSVIGNFCKKQLEEIPQHYRYAYVESFVVMPNHIHAIIVIDNFHFSEADEPRGDAIHTRGSLPAKRTALSIVVGGFKREVTLYARRHGLSFGWQERYHDHIIRGVQDGDRISLYIANNVVNWDKDCFFDE